MRKLGVHLLHELREHPDVEVHLVLSRWAKSTLHYETGLSTKDGAALADHLYSPDDQGTTISSGSFRTDGMVTVPYSMKTLTSRRTTPGAWRGMAPERGRNYDHASDGGADTE